MSEKWRTCKVCGLRYAPVTKMGRPVGKVVCPAADGTHVPQIPRGSLSVEDAGRWIPRWKAHGLLPADVVD